MVEDRAFIPEHLVDGKNWRALLPIDLEREIALSGLDAGAVKLFQKHSAGLYSIEEMPVLWDEVLSQDKPVDSRHRGYALGLSYSNHAYQGISQAYELADWQKGFERFGLSYRSEWRKKEGWVYLRSENGEVVEDPRKDILKVTHRYLEKITAKEVPVFMFVPVNYKDHSSALITREEIEWFIKHPLQTSQVHFVFGLYSCINKHWYRYVTQFMDDEEEKIAVVSKALVNG